ncbi:DNA-binding transcriptional LysR family regulator [Parvibaculum indicum]|uniref:LysR substrate-binding domain-containing protein n=1 Tax=Parvibaculum indicum TaxID=562969 RepID=UPI001420DA25|nr:LysR substrate-binding domain-containing protein [Parvibaculum indicum]NIJ40968.1 DNA-binding transcriptional LysR family regulator [Parvibaculum indicum]
MDSTDLRFFRAVAATGTIAGAAAELNCVPSNVTTRIRQMEARLGTPLFFRHSRGMKLTRAGEALLPFAEQNDDLLTRARHAVQEADGMNAPLRLGAMETAAAIRMPGLIARLKEKLPGLALSLMTGNSQMLAEAVLERRIDGAFVSSAREGAPWPDGIEAVPAFEESMVLIEPAGGARQDDTLLVFGHGCSYRQMAEDWIAEAEGGAPEIMEFGSLDAIVGCVAAGLGRSLVPEAAARASVYAADITITPPGPRYAHAPTFFIRRRDMPETRSMSELLALTREMAAAGTPPPRQRQKRRPAA